MVAKRSDHDNETCNIVSLLGRGTKESTMGVERLARKLTAILYADVTGYKGRSPRCHELLGGDNL